MTRRLFIVVGAALTGILGTTAHATSYKFTVSCETKRHVVEWRTGAIDPGREFLRVSTGSHYPNCSVSHFDPARDSGLDVQVNEGGVGVLKGVPLLGEAAGELPIVNDVMKGLGGLFK